MTQAWDAATIFRWRSVLEDRLSETPPRGCRACTALASGRSLTVFAANHASDAAIARAWPYLWEELATAVMARRGRWARHSSSAPQTMRGKLARSASSAGRGPPSEHVLLEWYVDARWRRRQAARINRLEQTDIEDVDTLQELFYGLYALISVHFRKEEDIQLPAFDAGAPGRHPRRSQADRVTRRAYARTRSLAARRSRRERELTSERGGERVAPSSLWAFGFAGLGASCGTMEPTPPVLGGNAPLPCAPIGNQWQPRQRSWLVRAVFALISFATSCHRLRPLCSINAPYAVVREGNTRAQAGGHRPPC
jgi:hypothetical protein